MSKDIVTSPVCANDWCLLDELRFHRGEAKRFQETAFPCKALNGRLAQLAWPIRQVGQTDADIAAECFAPRKREHKWI